MRKNHRTWCKNVEIVRAELKTKRAQASLSLKKEKLGGKSRRATFAKVWFRVILESRAVSPAILLVRWRHFLFARLSRRGSKEFLQRHNSARNFRPLGERISLTISIQEGAIGFRYSANSASTTLVKCLESCRRQEKRAIGEWYACRAAFPDQLLLDPCTLIQCARKIEKVI